MHIEQKQDRIFKPNSIYTLSAEETNQQTTELEGLISHAGLTPSASDLTQVSQAVDALIAEATPIATSSTIGLVKPDNETVTVSSDGTLTAVGGGTGSGKQIGEVFYSQSSSAQDNPGALPLFTGETISNADQVYPEFYAWVADHANLQISAADYETALSTYGECPKYVIDTVNKTIRLPKLVNYLKMANSTDGITQTGAGLPNIYTEISSRKFQNGIGVIANVTGSGTFENDGYTAASNVYSKENMSSSYSLQKSTVDASVGSNIYGHSNTVTPAHTTLFPWVCAYNAAVPASTAQAAQFQAALSSKLDSDFGNSTKPYVTETYVNGTSWYRIWSDGWCEQGNSKVPSSTSWETILLLKQYKDTNYQVIATNNGNINGTSSWTTVVDCQVYTRDSIQLKGAGADANWLISWKTCGYIR